MTTNMTNDNAIHQNILSFVQKKDPKAENIISIAADSTIYYGCNDDIIVHSMQPSVSLVNILGLNDFTDGVSIGELVLSNDPDLVAVFKTPADTTIHARVMDNALHIRRITEKDGYSLTSRWEPCPAEDCAMLTELNGRIV